jgi:hypothetical protein
MPKNCAWNSHDCSSNSNTCDKGKFLLNTDTSSDEEGDDKCLVGSASARSLCCDSTSLLENCIWTGCQGPLGYSDYPACPKGYDYQTFRFDKPDGTRWCSDEYVFEGKKVGSPYHTSFKSALCCPGQTFTSCNWSNDVTNSNIKDPNSLCNPSSCKDTQIQITTALDPPPYQGDNCEYATSPAGGSLYYPYCCSPPSKYTNDWPVDPKKLWEIYYDNSTSDVMWSYSDEQANNDHDPPKTGQSTDGTEDYGEDAYGFVMLDGPQGSLDNSFSTVYTVIRQTKDVPKVKRSSLTTNQTILEQVFEHSEETIHIYCNHPLESTECGRIWIDGAEDTIIRLPAHIGEGPFARLVSIKHVDDDFSIPTHHLEHRSTDGLATPIYEVKIDYDFHAITPKRDDANVNIRVDYTNLLGYWDEMTDSTSTKRKRDGSPIGVTDWHARLNRAITRDKAVRKQSGPINITVPMEQDSVIDTTYNELDKRWWGTFTNWLKRLVHHPRDIILTLFF